MDLESFGVELCIVTNKLPSFGPWLSKLAFLSKSLGSQTTLREAWFWCKFVICCQFCLSWKRTSDRQRERSMCWPPSLVPSVQPHSLHREILFVWLYQAHPSNLTWRFKTHTVVSATNSRRPDACMNPHLQDSPCRLHQLTFRASSFGEHPCQLNWDSCWLQEGGCYLTPRGTSQCCVSKILTSKTTNTLILIQASLFSSWNVFSMDDKILINNKIDSLVFKGVKGWKGSVSTRGRWIKRYQSDPKEPSEGWSHIEVSLAY